MNLVPTEWSNAILDKLGVGNLEDRLISDSTTLFWRDLTMLFSSFLVGVLLLFFLVWVYFLSLKIKLIQKAYNSLKQQLVFGMFLTLYLRSYLGYLSGLYQERESESESMSSAEQSRILQAISEEDQNEIKQTTTLVLIYILGLSPLMMLAFLIYNRKKLQQEAFNLKYGSLYIDLKHTRSTVLWYSFYFVLRRLALVVIS